MLRFCFRFILSLSITDLCLGLFVMIPAIVKSKKWRWGIPLCKAWVTADIFFCCVSIYTLLGISVDRFLAVYKPIIYATWKNFLTNLLIPFAWIMSLLIILPMHIDYPGFSNWSSTFLQHLDHLEEFHGCSPPHGPESAGFNIYAAIMTFIMPFLTLIILYVTIAIRLRSRTEKKISRIKKQVSFMPFETIQINSI